MPTKNRIVSLGYKKGTVVSEEGEVLVPPADWVYLAAGDGPLTRNVKSRGVSWQVQVQMGRRNIKKGIWAPGENVAAAKKEVEAKRATPQYEKRLAADRDRRARKQQAYVEDFYGETLTFLAFHPDHQDFAEKLARAVTEHATPVGSGTVARTECIPVAERVQAAVIAWMRHNTTAYDRMSIARIKGKRREVRRMLAQRSNALLDSYRRGNVVDPNCPLYRALIKPV
ncbi:DUF2293 domain-containing protein [Desulfopila aestuarii]|uniref:Uncharacterized conserved protein n=1 Tax=Desulfopila aestuarii DSM 18488 TaxID=1121416 RepID=A0A1M7Y9T7_9BACT|nr:DUF2293 domain-containing protein [Desulfopila aestuarii]SHO49336.1 Uncharacterized conserved protein [Desulfopila aestuarii DSM 18488]